MLTANKLEKIMELESQLRDQYQGKLDAKDQELDALRARQAELEATVEKQRATVETQLENLKDLSEKATANQRVEQHNRELTNRSEKLQAELTDYKKRVKGLQKDLQAVREENKVLNQYDPPRMKKSLDAGKKKLAEKQKANDSLQKALNQTKKENLELERKVAELEAKLKALEPEDAEVCEDTVAEADAKEQEAA